MNQVPPGRDRCAEAGDAQSGAAGYAVLIPALNCALTIRHVVAGALRQATTVVVVSDGSTDTTASEARAAGARVLEHDSCRGKGAALLTGMRALLAAGFSHVLTMDGDGQHLAEEIPVLVGFSREQPGALVIGVRQVAADAVAPMRVFGNRFANRWVEIASGQRLPDTQSGFRIYPLASVLGLGVRSTHFGFETEVIIRAARAGISVQSVPVQVYYPPVAERVSHFRPFVDTVRIIFIVLGLIFRVW